MSGTSHEIALVTGAARGIGLELCRQLLAGGRRVVACARAATTPELDELVRSAGDQLVATVMDVADDRSVEAAARRVADGIPRLDLLFNNAGVYPDETGGLERLDAAELTRAFEVNAVGVLRVTRAFLPLLRRGHGKRIVQVTSLMGSIGDNTSGGSYAYRMSKAALNMATRNLAHELGPEGFVCLAIHPGWVKTRMGGSAAPLGLRESVEQILDNVLSAGPRDNGGFRGPGRKVLPW